MSVNWTFFWTETIQWTVHPCRTAHSRRTVHFRQTVHFRLIIAFVILVNFTGPFYFVRPFKLCQDRFIPSDGSLWNVQNSLKPVFWEVRLLILIPVTILIFPYSELIWKNLLRNTCAHHWIFIWHHIVREERNHVSDAIHLILNEKLGVLQNVFPTNSWSMTNVASQTSGKFVTKVNLTFVTFSLSNRLCDIEIFEK